MKKIFLFLIITLLVLNFSACTYDIGDKIDSLERSSNSAKRENSDNEEKEYDDEILDEDEITKTNIFMIKDENEKILLVNSDIKKVFLKFDEATEDYVIQLLFTTEGATKFENATAANVGKALGIYISEYIENGEEFYYDLQLISNPIVQEKITGNECIISGLSDKKSAREIFKKLTK